MVEPVAGNESSHQGTTLHKFICQIQPYYWEQNVWELDKWFEWPPDVFALTSLILNYTGAYRRAISPANDIWPKANWPSTAKSIATEWRNSIADGKPLPAKLLERKAVLEENRELFVDYLYDSENDDIVSGNPWKLCKALLELHAIADEAMRGVGIIYSPRSSLLQEEMAQASAAAGSDEGQEEPNERWAGWEEISPKTAFFYLQANFLLTLRGSLSRVPKYRGIVLPKSRTPQVGLSLRSLSSHLSFHQSEVDVAWRAFPWFNFDENTISVMVVPWPYQISATHFSSVLHPKTQQELGSHRYFHYEPQANNPLDVEKLVRLIENAKKEVRRIHLLVFPEMALRRSDLKRLKDVLEERLAPHEMPMIIAGVSARLKDSENEEDPDEKNDDKRTAKASGHFGVPERGAVGFNRVILSVYYAEKWHDVIQDKHHRWKIDSKQIEQYNLGGVLAGGRIWWEAIHIPRRRLSVLAANSWLTICPLICEDLARLEPVSDLIRGVGPTLVTALLLDGPQLKNRWPARYASVLADDPGSSVLTLTSLGMSRRSRPTGIMTPEMLSNALKNERVVALWKDQEKGWREISVDEKEGCEPKVLIVSALWTTEATCDGRKESDNSAVFTFQGMYQPVDGTVGSNAPPPPQLALGSEDAPRSRDEDAARKFLKVLDMCELTLYTFYVDALVDSQTETDFLKEWFDNSVRTLTKKELGSYSRLTRELIELDQYSIRTRDSVPRELPSPHLMYAIENVTSLVRSVEESLGFAVKSPEEVLKYWKALTGHAEAVLKKTEADFKSWIEVQDQKYWEQMIVDRNRAVEMSRELCGAKLHGNRAVDVHVAAYEIGRIRLSTPLTILWSLHVRLATRRRYGTLGPVDASLLERIETILSGATIPYHRTYLKWKRVCKDREIALGWPQRSSL